MKGRYRGRVAEWEERERRSDCRVTFHLNSHLLISSALQCTARYMRHAGTFTASHSYVFHEFVCFRILRDISTKDSRGKAADPRPWQSAGALIPSYRSIHPPGLFSAVSHGSHLVTVVSRLQGAVHCCGCCGHSVIGSFAHLFANAFERPPCRISSWLFPDLVIRRSRPSHWTSCRVPQIGFLPRLP